MTTDDFYDLLVNPATRIGATQCLDDMLRRVPEPLAQLCMDRLRGLRERVARNPPDEDENLP
jgi:hypothetical protein